MHTDEHDLGLMHDLATLRQRVALAARTYDRRNALAVLGAAGAGLVLVACGKEGQRQRGGVYDGFVSRRGFVGRRGDEGAHRGRAVLSRDGTNGPDVVDRERRRAKRHDHELRSVLRHRDRRPMTMQLTVVHAGTGAAYAGAAV